MTKTLKCVASDVRLDDADTCMLASGKCGEPHTNDAIGIYALQEFPLYIACHYTEY